jgi:hypothetical protein
MTTIDTLRYILALDTKKFVAESKRAEMQTNKLTNSIGTKLEGAIKGAVTAYLGWRSLNVAADMVQIAAQADRVTYSFNAIAANLGLSGQKIIAELKDASRGTVSELKLMTQASRAAVMELPMKDLPELMKISRAAAKAFGQDTSYMFESIVLGIARQSRLILDNLGIIVNQEAIYRKETKRLGRELTEAEKKQVFFNEALRQGQSIIEAIGDDTEDYADQLAKMNVQWEELKINIGKTIAETGLLSAITQLWNFFDRFAPLVYLWETITEGTKTFLRLPEDILAIIKGELSVAEWFWGKEEERGKTLSDLQKLKQQTDEFVKLFSITVTAIDPKSIYNKAKEIQEIYFNLGKVTLDYMIEYYEKELDRYKENAKIKEDIEKRLHALRMEHLKREIEAEGFIGPMPQEPYMGTERRPLSGPMIGTISRSIELFRQRTEELNEAAKETPEYIQLLEGALDGLVNSIDGAIGDIIRIGADLASGNYYSAGANIAGMIIDDLFGGTNKLAEVQAEYAKTVDRLIDAMERSMDAVNNLTYAEMQRQQALVAQAISLGQELVGAFSDELITPADMANVREYRNILDQLGYSYDEITAIIYDLVYGTDLFIESLTEWLALITMSAENFAALQQVGGFEDATNFLTMLAGQGQLGFQQGMNLISFFTEMFDLTAEQQEILYQLLEDLLGDALTAEQWMQLQTSLDRVREEGIPIQDPGTGYQPSQTLRSVTTITETQANLMTGILNAINLEIRKLVTRADDILEIMRDWTLPAGAGAGGGTTVYMTVHASGSSGEKFAQDVANEFRSLGIKVA